VQKLAFLHSAERQPISVSVFAEIISLLADGLPGIRINVDPLGQPPSYVHRKAENAQVRVPDEVG
jgi:hypothetical protein